ncbi:hypothetical protein K1719_016071 [Acacia pycnantha]|nr:hypothetical protein K1719_016071 [Acacia pycnantha]
MTRLSWGNHLKLEVKFKLPLRDSELELDTMLEARRRGGKRTNVPSKPKDVKFDVMNSSNGSLCLCDPYERNPFLVCNPIM